MKQTVIVNGADQFVGQRVLTALLASDWAAPIAVGTGDTTALRQQLAGAQAVAHCIGGAASTVERGARDLYGALAATQNALQVVHLSSMTVYGSATGVVDEDASLLADLGAYSQAQLQAENLARDYRNAVVLRPGAEYGPGCPYWTGQIARLLRARRLGDLGAAGDGMANLVFIDDLVAAVLAALRLPGLAGQTFNIVMPDKPTWNDYFVAFARALGAVPVRRITRRQLNLETRLLAPPLKIAQLCAQVLHLPPAIVPPPLPPSLARLCSQEISVAAEKATRRLEMRWTTMHQGLQRAVAS